MNKTTYIENILFFYHKLITKRQTKLQVQVVLDYLSFKYRLALGY